MASEEDPGGRVLGRRAMTPPWFFRIEMHPVSWTAGQAGRAWGPNSVWLIDPVSGAACVGWRSARCCRRGRHGLRRGCGKPFGPCARSSARRRSAPSWNCPRHSGASYGAGDAVFGQKPLKLLACILRPLARVMRRSLGLPAPPDRHHRCVHGQWGIPASFHRAAHHAPGKQVRHDSNIKPPRRSGCR